jgi:hypothetical protein
LTLVEIVLALGILMLGLLPLLSLFGAQAVTIRDLGDYSQAMNMAEGEIHRYVQLVQALPASETFALFEEDVTAEARGLFPEQAAQLGLGLKVIADVRALSDAPAYGFQIRMKVLWGDRRVIDLATVLARREVLVLSSERLEEGVDTKPRKGVRRRR